MSRSTADWLLRLEPDAWVLRTGGDRFTHTLEGATPAAELRRLDADPVRRKGVLKVVIADGWLRYLVVPWPEGVSRAEERKAFLAHRFREVHGVGEPDWLVAADRAAEGAPALACAVPATLVAAVQDFATRHGLRLDGVCGDFVEAYNRLRPAFREARGTVGALALAHGGRVTVGMWCDGSWHTVRSQALRADNADGVRLMLDAWQRGAPALGASATVDAVLYADGLAPSVPSGWRVAAVGERA